MLFRSIPICFSDPLTLCSRHNLAACEGVSAVQPDDIDTHSSSSDDSRDDSIEILRSWEQYEWFKPLTTEDTVTINLSGTQDPKEVKIGANLSEEKAMHIVALLKDYQDISAWSYSDRPGLDPPGC